MLDFPLYKIRLFALRKICNGKIGNQVYVGDHLTITVGDSYKTVKLVIGNRVAFGPHVTLVLVSHPNYSKLKKLLSSFPKKEIEIGDDSWIGANAVIMPNVKIDKMCIIGAGAVVAKDVPDYSVVAGVPAKIIKKIDDNCR